MFSTENNVDSAINRKLRLMLVRRYVSHGYKTCAYRGGHCCLHRSGPIAGNRTRGDLICGKPIHSDH